ncbi:MAG TPA: ABC transporter ATP-binding protein [Candidatus Saccharimonadales bacterium]|nr:ABC transporter ATP-binding protein [Candidatus Saccharimonadales bacterium]
MTGKKATGSAVIRANNLTAGYGTHIIWEHATFHVHEGEFVGILGPNGAGKTTLFRLLLGLANPTSGNLEIFGNSPKRGNPRIGYVPQRHPIDSELRIEALELVRLGVAGQYWGFALPSQAIVEREQARQALRIVDAEGLAHRALGQLSGGELQRVFLAQALVDQPDILLLDEPLANLDIRRQTELVKLVATIAKEQNVAILLIAHDINPLLPVVDRLIYTVNGRIATGKPDEIITTKALSALYGAPVEVLRGSRGRLAVLGTEEAVHHD